MNTAHLITLLTDFGLEDSYVGVIKGVILSIQPQATLVDLTHQIPPQALAIARFQLMNAVPYFPAGTVHLAVVDPGVGTERRPIAVAFSQGWLVGPDNGLFSGVLSQFPDFQAVALTRSAYWRTSNPSATFHGRDIFAPVAAHLSKGLPLTELGDPLAPDSLVNLLIPTYQTTEEGLEGTIQGVDRFGNLITTIPATAIPPGNWLVRLQNQTIPQAITYGTVPEGQLLALVGSHGWLEIACNGGSAQANLQIQGNETLNLLPLD